jgi:hypothetical protein
MTRPSSIDRLEAPLREEIGRLRIDKGYTIDQILAHLKTMEVVVSRSAMGRHIQKLETIGARLKESRAVAEALVQRFGEKTDDKLARLNVEMMHGIVMDVISKADEAGTGALLDPEQVMFMARALRELAAASKTDTDRMMNAAKLKASQETAAKAAAAVETAAKTQKGLSKETVEAIKHAVLGVAG